MPKPRGTKRDYSGGSESPTTDEEGDVEMGDSGQEPPKKRRMLPGHGSAPEAVPTKLSSSSDPEEDIRRRNTRGDAPSPSQSPGQQPSTPGQPEAENINEAYENVLVLEYMPRGDLDRWMNKMGSMKRKSQVPMEVLWQIFDCCKSLSPVSWL
jgi:hypothetical protein